ncbi:MAG: hypothetical protein ACLUHE_05425 [Christensenellales bacterium]
MVMFISGRVSLELLAHLMLPKVDGQCPRISFFFRRKNAPVRRAPEDS